MTTFTNFECKFSTYTNECLETVLLQLNSSNNYHTSGEYYIIFIEMGSNKISTLDYTYLIKRNIVQNCTINETPINNYDLELIVNGTSNEYDLQSVYNVNKFIGAKTELSQVF